jgi:hypothetical protein
MNEMLNDLSSLQSQRFSKGSKMSMFLRTKSGSRPESILAQATSMSGVKNTHVAEDLAMRLRYVNEKGLDPVALENVLGSLVATAQQDQAQAQTQVVTQVNRGVPLDQATQTVEQGLQATEMSDAELSEELDYAEKAEEESSRPMTEGMDLYNSLNSMSRQDLMSYYSRIKQTGALPASHFRRGGFTKGDIIGAILEQRPDLMAEDVRAHSSLMNNAVSLREGLRHEHAHPIRSQSERESSSEMEVSPTKMGGTVEIASDVDSSSTEYVTAEEQIEEAQTSQARTASARFEERHHIPEWLNAFTHTASDMLRGERGSEGIARRATPREQGEL